MTKYRNKLPQLGDQLFLTDGGLETTLIFKHDIDLPHFAAFVLLDNEAGRNTLSNYYQDYIEIAKKKANGFILESPTWRASPDWSQKIGYSKDKLAELIHTSIDELDKLRGQHEAEDFKMVISGNIGPRGDGYSSDAKMTEAEAEEYHSFQISEFRSIMIKISGILLCTLILQYASLEQFNERIY